MVMANQHYRRTWTDTVCASCNQKLLAGHYYAWMIGYMCCSTVPEFLQA
jgi:hypothetical protein